MELTSLLKQVMVRMPSAKPAEVFRMAMLLCHAHSDAGWARSEETHELDLSGSIDRRLQEISLQLTLQEDQHAAIAEELDSLASTEPCQFSVQHLWTLIRAIKVQSQLLNLYLGPQADAHPEADLAEQSAGERA